MLLSVISKRLQAKLSRSSLPLFSPLAWHSRERKALQDVSPAGLKPLCPQQSDRGASQPQHSAAGLIRGLSVPRRLCLLQGWSLSAGSNPTNLWTFPSAASVPAGGTFLVYTKFNNAGAGSGALTGSNQVCSTCCVQLSPHRYQRCRGQQQALTGAFDQVPAAVVHSFVHVSDMAELVGNALTGAN